MFRALLRVLLHIAKLVLAVRLTARIAAASMVGVHANRSVFRSSVDTGHRITVV
jgi:hypothetical protein